MSSAANEAELDQLCYPIGHPEYPDAISNEQIRRWIASLENLPADLRKITEDLNDARLDTPYRPNGWTVRQVVHHLADSHMHSYIRFRRAVTEENPLVTAYDQKKWAELPDARNAPVELSLRLLGALHARWAALLKELTPDQWNRTYNHSELGPVSLERALVLYEWHGRHHLSQIAKLRDRMGW
jgi:hypothetical protein